jgi:hypothetical protein
MPSTSIRVSARIDDDEAGRHVVRGNFGAAPIDVMGPVVADRVSAIDGRRNVRPKDAGWSATVPSSPAR